MLRKISLVLFLFCTNIYAPPPNTINTSQISNGDIVGISSRREVSGFMVQAFTHSPVDHVGVVEKGPDGAFVWHLTRAGSEKMPLAEFMQKYRAPDGQLYYVLGRLNPPLTPPQQKEVFNRLSKTPDSTGKAPICSEYVAEAFLSSGVELGRRVQIVDPTTNPLAGFMAQHWNRFFQGHTSSIPSATLFDGRVKVISGNIPLSWTDSELLEAWEKTGDASKVARIYFPGTRVEGPQEAQMISQAFFSALRRTLASDAPACPFERLSASYTY